MYFPRKMRSDLNHTDKLYIELHVSLNYTKYTLDIKYHLMITQSNINHILNIMKYKWELGRYVQLTIYLNGDIKKMLLNTE